MAVNCFVVLLLIVGFVGVTAMEESTGAVAVLDLDMQPGMITKATATKTETRACRMNREGTVISYLYGDHSNFYPGLTTTGASPPYSNAISVLCDISMNTRKLRIISKPRRNFGHATRRGLCAKQRGAWVFNICIARGPIVRDTLSRLGAGTRMLRLKADIGPVPVMNHFELPPHPPPDPE